MKDKHLKEKRTLLEQFMMNDSRTGMTAEVREEALTRLLKKQVLKVLKRTEPLTTRDD